MSMKTQFTLYDSINTMAVRWLLANAKERKTLLGIKDFKKENKTHLWLLELMDCYSVSMKYVDIYLQCSLIDFLWMKYVMKVRHIKRWHNNHNVFLIEPEVFAKEITNQYNQEASIVEDIYDEYWG